MKKYENVLILSPHTDDAELGCGGSISRFLKEGVKVTIAVFSTAKESVPSGQSRDQLKVEFLNSMKIMGLNEEQILLYDYPVRKLNFHRQDILENLVQIRKELNPDLVFIPSSQDVHQDHQVIQAEGLRAFKNSSLLGYELPWNHITFSAQAFLKVEKTDIDKKLECLKEYKTQLQIKRGYFTEEFIYGLAKVRGTQVGYDYAEAFEVFRISI